MSINYLIILKFDPNIDPINILSQSCFWIQRFNQPPLTKWNITENLTDTTENWKFWGIVMRDCILVKLEENFLESETYYVTWRWNFIQLVFENAMLL